MPYGIIKVDTVTFTDNGVDKNISLSGLVQNPTFTGNVTATGTISGDVIRGGTTISGVTVTGTTANFVSGVFTTQVSGATVIAPTGTFTSLTGTTATFTSGIIASGTAALPSLAVLSDPNTGLFSPGADQLAISTNGTGRLFVTASGNIGTPAIGSTALANQRLLLTGSNEASVFYGLYAHNDSFAAAGSTRISLSPQYSFAYNTAPYIQSISESTTAAAIAIGTTTGGTVSERLRITSGGLVGLGTSSPSSLLHLSVASAAVDGTKGVRIANGAGTIAIFECGSSNDSYVGTTSGSAFSIRTNNTSAISIDSSQRVGIGTSSPTDTNGFGQCIDIRSNTGAAIYLRDSDDTTNDTFVIGRDNADSYLISNSGNILFSNAGSERMRIDSSGRLLVGTSSWSGSSSNTGGIEIYSTNYVAGGQVTEKLGSWRANMNDNNGGADVGIDYYRMPRGGGVQSGTEIRFFTGYSYLGGTFQRMVIDQNGTITFNAYGAGTLSTNASGVISASDGRYKTKTRQLDNSLDVIAALKPTYYKWNEGSPFASEHEELGFVAQEVAAVIPEASPGEDEEGKYRNYHDRAIIAMLVRGMQEQQAMIAALNSRVAFLEGA